MSSSGDDDDDTPSKPAPPKPGHYVNPDFTPSDIFKLADQTGGEDPGDLGRAEDGRGAGPYRRVRVTVH